MKKRDALEKNSNLLADRPMLALAHTDNVLALYPNFSLVRLHPSYEMFKQNAFATAAPTDDGKSFTGPHLKINAAQNLLLSDFFCQRANPDHRRRITWNRMRFGRRPWRRRCFDHGNTRTLNSPLSTFNCSKNSITALIDSPPGR